MIASSYGVARALNAHWCMEFGQRYADSLEWVVPGPSSCPGLFLRTPLYEQGWYITSMFRSVGSNDYYARYSSVYYNSTYPRIRLFGCMQSYKYFDPKVPIPFRLRTREAALEWVANHNITTAIHIRRGDKLWHIGNVIPPVEYYKQAISLLKRIWPDEHVFVVLTDDPEWVKRQDIFKGAHHLSSPDPAFDMAVISLCRHKILSIGTFGWWAAFLEDTGNNLTQSVIYPIPQMSAPLDEGFSNEDYFPPHWISVDYMRGYT
jgi:galactoside 2-L-fucosyltransferase 1/2